ncbi:VOC family protein [Gemmatimonas sp.]|jgi:predicted enzyme related to lactoylglutathione lyase|uniref:VOC family protein n=1 Tax=Gemmatimonas sp. TaxID=1962908 RepID=UPI0037BEE284
MTMHNAIGWFDLYVDDLDRAAKFYETVFQQPLEPMGDPTGETVMRSFPGNMQADGAAGALVKAPHARASQVFHRTVRLGGPLHGH